MNLAKVLPIHKVGAKTDPSSYRQLSILLTVSKIFEKKKNKTKTICSSTFNKVSKQIQIDA